MRVWVNQSTFYFNVRTSFEQPEAWAISLKFSPHSLLFPFISPFSLLLHSVRLVKFYSCRTNGFILLATCFSLRKIKIKVFSYLISCPYVLVSYVLMSAGLLSLFSAWSGKFAVFSLTAQSFPLPCSAAVIWWWLQISYTGLTKPTSSSCLCLEDYVFNGLFHTFVNCPLCLKPL